MRFKGKCHCLLRKVVTASCRHRLTGTFLPSPSQAIGVPLSQPERQAGDIHSLMSRDRGSGEGEMSLGQHSAGCVGVEAAGIDGWGAACCCIAEWRRWALVDGIDAVCAAFHGSAGASQSDLRGLRLIAGKGLRIYGSSDARIISPLHSLRCAQRKALRGMSCCSPISLRCIGATLFRYRVETTVVAPGRPVDGSFQFHFKSAVQGRIHRPEGE